jgi:hypothetical protein
MCGNQEPRNKKANSTKRGNHRKVRIIENYSKINWKAKEYNSDNDQKACDD